MTWYFDNMVRFTLEYPMADSMIRMEIPDRESMSELNETVKEYWGGNDVVFVRGYELLDKDSRVGDVLREGDIVEALPDPRRTSCDPPKGRVQYGNRHGGPWSEGSGLRRTS